MRQLRLMWETEMDCLDWQSDVKADKPVLIISCSKAKVEGEGEMPAIDLYQGQTFNYLRAHPFLQVFNVLILSAKWGLLNANEVIDNYDVEMSNVDMDEFLSMHSEGMSKRLTKLAGGQRIYSFLPKNYRSVLETFMESSQGEKIRCLSTGFYSCWSHRGNGELKERMAKALDFEMNNRNLTPFSTVYRSGTASNLEEIIGYASAGQAIGTSLYHLGDKEKAFRAVIAVAHERRVFVDNGMLQLVSNNLPIDLEGVIDQYIEFANKAAKLTYDFGVDYPVDELLENGIEGNFHGDIERVLGNLSFVIPDNPYCAEQAMELLERFKDKIQKLMSMGIEMIIPVHKRPEGEKEDVHLRVQQIIQMFGYSDLIRIGIPTLDKGKHRYALTSPMIESILSLKEAGQFIVKRVHFLGQGDTNTYLPTRSRNLLVSLYGTDVSIDSCRTRPTFKNKSVMARTKRIICDWEMSSLADVIIKLKEEEAVDAEILFQWNCYMHKHGVDAFVEAWNAHVRYSHDEIDTGDYFGDYEEEWFDEVMESSLNTSSYVDVWVNLNRADYLAENNLPSVVGQKKREVVLNAVFGDDYVKTDNRRFTDWGKVISHVL